MAKKRAKKKPVVSRKDLKKNLLEVVIPWDLPSSRRALVERMYQLREKITVGDLEINVLADHMARTVFHRPDNVPPGVSLVQVSVEKLGFKEGAPYYQICQKAEQKGLHLCPLAIVFPFCEGLDSYELSARPRSKKLFIASELAKLDSEDSAKLLIFTVGWDKQGDIFIEAEEPFGPAPSFEKDSYGPQEVFVFVSDELLFTVLPSDYSCG